MANEKTKVDVLERSLSSKDVYTIIEKMLMVQQPVMLWGQPGIGKSEVIQQLAKHLGRNLIDIRLVTMDATDLRGIPYYSKQDNAMKWAVPSCLPTDPDDTSIIYFDELTAADPSLQKAALQLFLDRRIGDYVLPKGCSLIAAGNRETDKTASNKMISALANRFVHLTMSFHFESWRDWAFSNTINPDVVGFLSAFPQYANTFDPKTNCKIFATPRTWTFVSKILDSDLPESLLMDTVAGTVGEGVMYAFNSHRKLSSKLPKPEDILTGKITSMPKSTRDMSVQHAMITSLVYKLNALNEVVDKPNGLTRQEWYKMADNFVSFIGNSENIEMEIAIMGMFIAVRSMRLPILEQNCPSVKTFFKNHSHLFV